MVAADWSREARRSAFEWAPGKSLLAAIRSWQRHRARGGAMAGLLAGLAFVRWRWWSIVSGASIPLSTRIGGGLELPHPQGVVINANAVIGDNCVIFHGATIGEYRGAAPTIGDWVHIGPGAVVLGGIEIGIHAYVGPLALVMEDVPAGHGAYAPRAAVRALDPGAPSANEPGHE